MKKLFVFVGIVLLAGMAMAQVPSAPRFAAPVRHPAIKLKTETPSAPGSTLSWIAPSSGCSVSCTYNVYRGATSGSEVLLVPGVTASPYLDSNVVRGNSYCWEVTAVNPQGESGRSNEACAQIPTVSSAPTGLTVTAGASGETLNWTAPSTGCTSACTYNIYRGATSGSEALLANGVAALTYLDSAVTRGNSYCWQTTAVNSAGESAKSNEVCGQVPTVPTAPTSLTVTTQ